MEIRPTDLKAITIKLASPEKIRSWSYGEVKSAETINYRTQKPERDGLFCERIFGPVKDYECSCGKYKGRRYKGQICDKCQVEITTASVRRERMGHINLAAPVAHIWYYKIPPSIIGLLLDIKSNDLERILYYDMYIITDVVESKIKGKEYRLKYKDKEEVIKLEPGVPLTETQYIKLKEELKDDFTAEMGASAIKKLLQKLDLEELSAEIRAKIHHETVQEKRGKLLKRHQIVEAFLTSGNKPEWTILEVLPVIPPDLRPLVPLEGGRYATSDLNDLYRRVITRNNRLKNMIALGAPEIILKNEKRMLQEAVDALLDNARRSKPIMGRGGQPLKSLSDILRGKKGRFRRNLLGKRVDYSGRSVIVVGPELKLYEVGLPQEMALELFKPFVERRMEKMGLAESIRSARKLLREKPKEVWEILEDITKDYPVLLNRAPTLHRISIEAFLPKLISGKAIQIHPLVCPPFNADFDGDQMAVYLPISMEAKLELLFLMLPRHNILSPAHGYPIIAPTQDMVIGINYLTKIKEKSKEKIRSFSSPEEAILAFENGKVSLHEKIKVLIKEKIIETSVGRIIFNNIVPPPLRFINEEINKKKLGNLIYECYKKFGSLVTEKFLDDIKDLGFKWAIRAGITFGIDELLVPTEKEKLIEKAEKEIEKVENEFLKGKISRGERYNMILDIWTQVTDRVTEMMVEKMRKDRDGFNSIFMMMDSGARGSVDQIKQLAAMRGLMAKPKRTIGLAGEFIETPVKSNLKEGMSVLEYFISTHGARKGLIDTALKTADAGYLTRKLVDVAQSVVITEEDCGTILGREITALKEGEAIIEPLSERITGRFAAEDIRNPITGEIIVKAGEEITEEIAQEIENLGIEKVKIRSVLTCESPHGICVKCYGMNLATGKNVEIGEPVGIVAAQSIGEPGTQLTLRTFHIGGAAARIMEESTHEAPFDAKVEYIGLGVAENSEGAKVAITKKGLIKLVSLEEKKMVRNYYIPQGAKVFVKDGDEVKKGDVICKWEPYNIPILASKSGIVEFKDLEEGVTFYESALEGGRIEKIVIEDKTKKKHPAILIMSDKKKILEEIALPKGAHLLVERGMTIKSGDIVAKLPREAGKTRDITGGLPRVAELFEARVPKDKAVVAEIDGIVKIGKPERGYREVKIISDVGTEITYTIPYGKYLLVEDGERIRAGDPLTIGQIDPHDVLRIKGVQAVQEFLMDQIQQIYRLSGVKIADKHIEVIVRQMMRKVKIEDPGDTKFVRGQFVDRVTVLEENANILERGGKPATYSPVLLGITRAALATESFISASSFQETTRVLAEAAIYGKKDELKGLKENVIVGSLIPAGTGFREFKNIQVIGEEEEELAIAE
ncbi:MAG: DNA-directed RNA polymerase subunit beta' [candidate division WOR-3 bacterium]